MMPTMSHSEIIARVAQVRVEQATTAIALLDQGNTIPFIARYRKELTGGLDEVQLRQISEEVARRRSLDERRDTILRSVHEQGKLTPDLEKAILSADTATALEDLYLPYRPKRRTRAWVARERGLEPLAQRILDQPSHLPPLDKVAAPYLHQDVPTAADAWAGARDIVAEIVSDNADLRARIRPLLQQKSVIRVSSREPGADLRGTYRMYHDFALLVRHLKPHQVLAIDRGEAEKVLRVEIQDPADQVLGDIQAVYRPNPSSPLRDELLAATEDSYARLIRPAMERELRRTLTEQAGDHAIRVFATNLRHLLLAPPLRHHTILAIDPGFRTGCKVAVIDQTGAVLATDTIYPHPPQKAWQKSASSLVQMACQFKVTLIAIGNGTASRETEQLATEVAHQLRGVRYLVVSEAGASVYSAMPLARQELPNLDVSLRGAVSIGRRTLDPLAELVKIEPKSIGVGLYQHDVDQKKLAQALDGVVESAVNYAGVNLNTASPALLRYVAGLGPKAAQAIVSHRDSCGAFRRRDQVLQVKGIGPRAYEQAAGFLRIPDGEIALDNTAVHPESYLVVERLVADVRSVNPSVEERRIWQSLPTLLPEYRRRFRNSQQMATHLSVGSMTLADILVELQKPGRDPRDEFPAPLLRTDVLSIEDLKPGMQLQGTIRNVVDFGAFVDIGVKQDGLVHVSELSEQRATDPYSIVSVGMVVQVTVLGVDTERNRIALSLRSPTGAGDPPILG